MNNIFSPWLWAHTIWATTNALCIKYDTQQLYLFCLFFIPGELIGVQYLFQQTGQALQDMNPDAEETAELIEELNVARWRWGLLWHQRGSHNCRSRGCSVHTLLHTYTGFFHPGPWPHTVSFITWTLWDCCLTCSLWNICFTSPLRARGCWSG